jgi:catechol 2,3-dioxygenase-like lactoylglutathione lyase family enzyme
MKMLTDAPAHATLPAVDLERAKKFYEGTLGLRVIFEDPSPGAVIQAGEGSTIYIYQRAATKADHTAAGFRVKDVEAIVKELKAKGVMFEDVDVPGLKTVEGIATMTTPTGEFKGAWFKDTEGNILSVNNM